MELDAILSRVLVEKKTIEGFFDAIFEFLSRRTSFYSSAKISNGNSLDERWQVVFAAFQSHEPISKDSEEACALDDHAPPAAEEIEVETDNLLEGTSQTNNLNATEHQTNKSTHVGKKRPNTKEGFPTVRRILPKSTLPSINGHSVVPVSGKRSRRVYKCPDCVEVFNSFRQLKDHEYVHMSSTVKGISICVYCCTLFANAETLEKHINECHTSCDKKYLCVPCQKSYTSRGQLLKHVQGGVHSANGLLYYCTLCPRSNSAVEFPSRNAIQQHFQTTHLLMPSSQEEDDVEIEMNEEFLDEFLLNNGNENSFHFSECWDALDLHLPDMLHLQNANCASIEQPCFAFKCAKCYEGFASQRELLRHLAHKHSLQVLICNQCERSFSDHGQWLRHKATHRTTRTAADDTLDGQLKCDVCNKTFKSKAALTYHLKTHSHAPLRTHECPYCSKCFYTDVNFRQHLRIVHTQTKRHICELCDKQFSTVDHLKKHVLSQHQNERKHICEQCHKRFTQLCHLKQHMAIHTTGKQQKCSFCPETFWRKIDLERHTLRQHV